VIEPTKCGTLLPLERTADEAKTKTANNAFACWRLINPKKPMPQRYGIGFEF